ncbi:metal-dependent CAAX amino terminal protease [Chloropicon primus]|nr:metal-dependent CAAX amino terminal protease [Chloropicon primus]
MDAVGAKPGRGGPPWRALRRRRRGPREGLVESRRRDGPRRSFAPSASGRKPAARRTRLHRQRTAVASARGDVDATGRGVSAARGGQDSVYERVVGQGKAERETPWDVKVIVQVITFWLVGFCLVGGVCIPLVTQWFGFQDQASLGLPPEQWKQAFFTVTVDIMEMCVGLGVLKACIGSYRPLEKGFFPFRLRGRWPLAVLLGCAMFPFVQYVANLSEGVRLSSSPLTTQSPLEWLPKEIMQLAPIELVAQSVYIFWTTCMSPIWEEILFRGFLVPSFARYLPNVVSIALSATIFALLHFSANRILPLTLLGILLGFVFTRTNNLMAPIALHSLWNVFAFVSAFTFPVVSML